MKTNGNSTTPNIIEPELSYAIVAAFYRVYKGLGWGYLKFTTKGPWKSCLRSMAWWLIVSTQYQSFSRTNKIGFQKLDLLVNKRIIVEVKSTEVMPSYAASQLRTYLAVSRLRLGILLHFGPKAVHHRVLGPKALG